MAYLCRFGALPSGPRALVGAEKEYGQGKSVLTVLRTADRLKMPVRRREQFVVG